MAGASRQHARIAANLAYLFVGQTKGRPCDVYSSDMRVKVNPTVIVDILSWRLS